jgi:hypothetical protein
MSFYEGEAKEQAKETDPLSSNPTRLTRQDTQQSFVSTASYSNGAVTGSISARRNQFHRQNSFGVPPNKLLDFAYKVKELTTSTDSTDEKTASTVLVRRGPLAVRLLIALGLGSYKLLPFVFLRMWSMW